MIHAQVHHMDAELVHDRQTMRYRCTVCAWCVEDGPEGVTVVHKGDPTVAHRGGQLEVVTDEVEQDPQAKPLLH
jgi:hypothetical protein